MKKILKALLVLIGMIAMLFVVAIIVNLSVFDEDLLPEVQAIQDIQVTPYETDNAYPAMAGFRLYKDMSFTMATETTRNQLNQNITESGQDYLNDQNWKQLSDNKIRTKALDLNLNCNFQEQPDCLKQHVNSLQNKPITDNDSKKLINRYSQLINYNTYSGATQVNFQSNLEFGPLLQTQRIFLIEHLLNNPHKFPTEILKDLAFWRMMLKNSNLLLTKVVSAAAVRTNIRIMALAIQSNELSYTQLFEIQKQINNGLTKQEQSLLTTLKFEMKGAMNYFDLYENESNEFLGQLFYQENATRNLHYLTNIKVLNNIDQLDSRDFYKVYQTKEWPGQHEFKSAISLYNPTGKQMITPTIFAYQDYFARMHDLNAMLVLLKLRIELALNDDQNIVSVVNNSTYKNPYTLKPFDYDAEANTIGFDCLDKTSVCEIAL